MKVQALQVFCALLEERKRRTQFLLRCDLLDWKTHMAFERGLTREDAQLLGNVVLPFTWMRLRCSLSISDAEAVSAMPDKGAVGEVGKGAFPRPARVSSHSRAQVNGLLAEQHLRREIRSYQSMREAGYAILL